MACMSPMPRTSPMISCFSLSSSQAAAQVGAGLGAVVHQVLLFDEIDDGFGRGGGDGIAAEGGDA